MRYKGYKRKKPTLLHLHIQPGCGYYDITSSPIGSFARRAPDDGLRVSDLVQLPCKWHGCNRTGSIHNGSRRIAFNTEMTMEYYHG